MVRVNNGDTVRFDYVNWEGKTSNRLVRVIDILYGTSSYHPEPQWLLYGADLDKLAYRHFAMKDMANFEIVRS